jgi:polyhydroxybutyrate depolymerase
MGQFAGLSIAAVALGLSVSAPASGGHVGAQPAFARVIVTATGCGLKVAAGTVTLTPAIGGQTRTVVVHIPRAYTGHTRLALVLNLHGSASTARQQEVFSGMDRSADAHHFIVAYPQAAIPDGSGYDWNIPNVPLTGGRPVPSGAADDVSFLKRLVIVLERRYCIDSRQVFATGMSGGRRMASQLGCDASNEIAAIAPVAGLRRPTPCPTQRAVPVVAFHGTADPIDPFAGHGQAYWTYSVSEAARLWAAQDGCAAKPATTRPAKGARLTTYRGCRDKAAVELYAVIGEGHEWPGGPLVGRRITVVLGPQSNAVNANEVMWTFFATHPLP